MLSFTYYSIDNDIVSIDVSEDVYERLYNAGISKVVKYNDIEMNIDNEKYNVYAVKLDFDNRELLNRIIKKEIENELEIMFSKMMYLDKLKNIYVLNNFLKYFKEINDNSYMHIFARTINLKNKDIYNIEDIILKELNNFFLENKIFIENTDFYYLGILLKIYYIINDDNNIYFSYE